MCVYISLSLYIYIYIYLSRTPPSPPSASATRRAACRRRLPGPAYIYIYTYIITYTCIYIYIYIPNIIPGVARRRRLPGPAHVHSIPNATHERLAEYGWKPHRMCVAQKNDHRPQFTCICVKHRGMWFHRIRDIKQYYFNSIPPTSQHSPKAA